MKRGFSRDLFLISAVFILIVLTGLVGLVEGAVQTESETQVGAVGETTTETTVETGGDVVVSEDAPSSEGAVDEVSSDEEAKVEQLIKEAEKFDEKLDVDAGLTPDSFFYFLDGIVDSREEKVAEMKEMAEACSKGDRGACGGFDVSFDKYKEHANKLEKEVSPEEREEAQRTSRAIRGVLIRDIAKNIDPTKKDDLVKKIVIKEKNIETAAEIADKINELCGQLVKLGAFEEASEVCKLEVDDKEEGAPDWLKEKRKQWKGEMSDDAKKFFEVLTQCMEITNDGKEGNSNECRCNEMPDAQAVLCVDIAAAEDACNDGKDESACGVSQPLIEQFMSSLPEDLRKAMERAMNKFGEEDFEIHGVPSECEEVGANNFVSCQEAMFRSRAPGPCLNALDRGEIEPTREACEKIMFRENVPKGCEGLDPNQCAEQYGGPDRGRGGPGVVFQVCDNIKDSSARLACYDDNANKVDFTRDYHEEKREFREEFGSKEFKNYGEYRKKFRGEFEGKFRKENVDKYADLYKSRREGYKKYYYNEEDERRRVEETLDREEACVKQCASEGKAWSFAGGVCQCFGGDYQQGGPGDYQGQGCPEGQHLVVQDPFRSSYCEYDNQQPPPTEPTSPPPTEPAPTTTTSPPPEGTTTSPTNEPAPQPASTTGSVISGRVILENPFLRYYFGY